MVVKEIDGGAATIQIADADTARRMGPDLHQGPGTGQVTALAKAQDPATVTEVDRKERTAEQARTSKKQHGPLRFMTRGRSRTWKRAPGSIQRVLKTDMVMTGSCK